MILKKLTLKTEGDTLNFGRCLGRRLFGGAVIELIGPLGSGKTTLAKAILAGAGVKAGGSPTFILDAVYPVKNSSSLREIHHLDLYRLNDPEELVTLGLYETIGDTHKAALIEWADRFPNFQNHGKLTIDITPKKNEQRLLKITASNAKHEELLQNSLSDFI